MIKHNTTTIAAQEVPCENFLLEDGLYRAEIKAFLDCDKPYKQQTERSIKIKFRILDKKPEFGEYVAGRRYPHSIAPDSELVHTLDSLLGPNSLAQLTEDGVVYLDRAIGTKVDIEVVCIDNGPEYGGPYVYPCKICPPGTLLKPTSNVGSALKGVPTLAPLKRVPR